MPSSQLPDRTRPAGTDVARLAGVSQKTVSRVMNNEPYVREELRERVLRAAQQLGYRPNGAARTLTSGRTGRLGVACLGAGLYGPTSMLVAVERSARLLGYATCVAHTSPEDGHGLVGAVESLLEQGVDGIVLIEATDEGPLKLSTNVPVLTLGRFPGLVAARRIRADEHSNRSGHTATRHLIALGHRQIRHVAGPQRWWAARDRSEGWRTALVEAALPVTEPIEGDWSCASGFAAGSLLARDEAMTAVFAANDDMAIGLIRALTDAGRRVPQEVSVVAMDDLPASRYLRPALTTVARDFDAIAVDGVAALIREIAEPGTAARTVAEREPRLIVRESTAPAPGRDRRPQAD
ncbi:LacI family DNA-binding transcriptional regulator [Actinospica durhamensis]|uniref:LacI family DNA-binding transcriptional regulator n=1 Tax=Actinospica durhamensis TaxID=1508375 RepID=A0A941IS67_9ACTN|nr:LacI family DNA-binding transcriptional regulator [Actinospica durhamensis]MBR7832931.1 LacI family DNA-binding transcriptional regulator [Actinospica durhamensis]